MYKYKSSWLQQPYQQKLPRKKSYGIACFRFVGEWQIVMVRKRCSYWFMEFVLGHYKMNEKNLFYLLNRMTNEEKIQLSLMDFSKIWFHLWLGNDKDKQQLYIMCKQKFERNFPNGFYLKTLIMRSETYTALWEIPKGRKDTPNEPELNCAIREMRLESGLSSMNYTIVDGLIKMMIYSNMKVQYVNKYFVAFMDNLSTCKLYSQDNLEIIEVKWVSLNHLKFLDTTGKILPFVRSIVRELKKNHKIGKIYDYQSKYKH
jgi:8-oxo-dGTP pyrophosphatase MutT (NUDIX family)